MARETQNHVNLNAPELDLSPGGRGRVLRGMGLAVAEKGYSATTIADVARHARISKRTFYEHFPDKETCFLAAYQAGNGWIMRGIEEAAQRSGSLDDKVRATTEAYFAALAASPDITRTFMVEIQTAGERALKARRETNSHFARLIHDLYAEGTGDDPPVELSVEMSEALAGAFRELALVAIEKRELGDGKYVDAGCDLVYAVVKSSR